MLNEQQAAHCRNVSQQGTSASGKGDDKENNCFNTDVEGKLQKLMQIDFEFFNKMRRLSESKTLDEMKTEFISSPQHQFIRYSQ